MATGSDKRDKIQSIYSFKKKNQKTKRQKKKDQEIQIAENEHS